jgi:hypothetical protein
MMLIERARVRQGNFSGRGATRDELRAAIEEPWARFCELGGGAAPAMRRTSSSREPSDRSRGRG